MPDTIELYGVKWPNSTLPIAREMHMVRWGGRFECDGKMVGEGVFFHVRKFQELLWPEKVWHRWNLEELRVYLEYRVIGELGPASSGKTHSAATNVLADYYIFPEHTTVLVSSTTRESLEMRIWGEIKKHHRMAKRRWSWLPGHLIEGRQRIVTDSRHEATEGRDFRNGIVGIACKRGDNYQGIGEYVGIKNKQLRLVGDELHLMPKAYTDAIANLNKNTGFKGLGLGNPKDTTDALGILCEPARELGGWDSGLDQEPGMKTWATNFQNGICLQLPGSDSPNLDGNLGCPLITQGAIDADIRTYGRDSIQYTMMDEGRMPRGMGNKRVITRQMCYKFHAIEPVTWADATQVDIGFMDAAYRGIGGDRCVFGHIKVGRAMDSEAYFDCIYLVETMVVPVKPLDPRNTEDSMTPEDQIATFVMDQCVKRNIKANHFGFDTTGRGSLMNAFGRIWTNDVVGIEFGGRPTERKVSSDIDVLCKDHYVDMVSELWFSVSYLVQSGQMRGLTDQVMDEGCYREWMFQDRKIKVEPKDKMKVKSGRSPDLFDALACGVEVARKTGFVIKRAPSVTKRRVDNQWKRDLKERAYESHHGKDLVYQ